METLALTGPEIVKLMNRHKITIRDLAKRMNITMKRVRQVRALGVEGQWYVLDWQEAITGTGLFQHRNEQPDTTLILSGGVRINLFGRTGKVTRISTDLGTARDTPYNKGAIDAFESVVLALAVSGVLMQDRVRQAVDDAITAIVFQLDDLPELSAAPPSGAHVAAASPTLSH